MRCSSSATGSAIAVALTALVDRANPELTRLSAHPMYLPAPVVFTTGVADAGNHYIVASGEADHADRITRMPKALFA